MSPLEVIAGLLPELPALLERGGWFGQQVLEPGPFTFQRAWQEINGGRLAVHCLPVSSNIQPFWHPHMQPIGVLSLGPGVYELSTGIGPGIQPPSGDSYPMYTAGRTTMRGVFAYELVDPQVWHAVRVHERPCLTICYFHRTGSPVALAQEPFGLKVSAGCLRAAIRACLRRTRPA